MAADRQVVERDKDGEPVRRAMGDGQGLGEELRSRLVVPLSEPDLAEEVVTPGQPSAIAGRGELVRIQLPGSGSGSAPGSRGTPDEAVIWAGDADPTRGGVTLDHRIRITVWDHHLLAL